MSVFYKIWWCWRWCCSLTKQPQLQVSMTRCHTSLHTYWGKRLLQLCSLSWYTRKGTQKRERTCSKKWTQSRRQVGSHSSWTHDSCIHLQYLLITLANIPPANIYKCFLRPCWRPVLRPTIVLQNHMYRLQSIWGIFYRNDKCSHHIVAQTMGVSFRNEHTRQSNGALICSV